MKEQSSNKTIAKNTVFMYLRMLLVTIVGLYTSRVILQTLGVEDFGIYTVASSAVALFSFLTGALGNASSRFITVEMGKANSNSNERLIRCFKTTKTVHCILAIIILLLCETVGLYVLYKASIPEERLNAAFWVFQISVAATIINVIQIPYNALIIAHEKMEVYAYISIFEVITKLLICYMLILSPIDKLVFYAILLFFVQSSVLLSYRLYSVKKFVECKKGYLLDNDFFKPLMSFSFWNLFGALSTTALMQGATIIISMFFGPVVVAARAIANQVKGQISNFTNNFRIAVNPQIIKRHAVGDEECSRRLLFFSCNLTFYLMLLFVIPLFLTTPLVLKLWLKDFPEYTIEFVRLVLIEMLFFVYDITFYQIFQSEGRLKENAIICPILDVFGLMVVCMLYKFGFHVLAIAWCMIILTAIQGMIIKPILAIKLFSYKLKDFLSVYYNNFWVLIVAILLPGIMYYLLQPGVATDVSLFSISVFSVLLSSFFVGLTKPERNLIIGMIKSRIKK